MVLRFQDRDEFILSQQVTYDSPYLLSCPTRNTNLGTFTEFRLSIPKGFIISLFLVILKGSENKCD